MSLQNIKTGQTAAPLEQLQVLNEQRRQETENGLLKEALAISNEQCSSLIGRQNMLIEDLTESVNALKRDNSSYAKRLNENVLTAVREMRAITQDERNFKAEVSEIIKSETTRSVNEAKEYALKQVDATLTEVKQRLKSTAKEIEREREEMKTERGIRKFLFWATPVLLLAQTFALLYLILT